MLSHFPIKTLESPNSLMEDIIVMNLNSFKHISRLPSDASAMIPDSHVLVPIDPTEDMIVNGF